MGTLNSSLNTIACGQSGSIGSGLKGCLARFKKAKKFLLTSAGYTFDGTEDFTDAYVAQLVAEGNVICFDYVQTIEDQSTQNTYEDIGDGRKVLDTEGLYEFKIKFVKGMYMHKVLSSYNGDSQFDFLAIDSEGNLIGTLASDGTSLKGFTLGVHQTELIEGIFSKNTPNESFVIQLTSTQEMANYAIKQKDDSFDGRNTPSINEVVLTFGATPSDTDTSVTVVAKLKQDNSVFTGAVYGQFAITVDGSAANPTGGDDSTTAGTYVLTGVTAISTGDVVTVDLYDVSNSRPGIAVGSYYYKSETITATAVA